VDSPRNSGQPRFRRQALLILLPVVVLAGVGVLSLRRDRQLAHADARDRALAHAPWRRPRPLNGQLRC
jgi:hypothetical protein